MDFCIPELIEEEEKRNKESSQERLKRHRFLSTPACQLSYMSVLRSHDQPTAGDATGKDTPFGH